MKMQEEPLANYGTKEFPLYYPNELDDKGIIPRKTLQRYCNKLPKEHVFKNLRIKLKLSNREAAMYVTLVSLNGLKNILCSTRRPIPKHILDYYKIEEYNKFQCEDAKWLDALKEVFGNELKIQHQVKNYRLDGYFPKYNIVLEIDEFDHMHYDSDKEYERTSTLNKMLHSPTYVRFNPFDNNITIFQIIGQIIRLIEETMAKK
jgi:very-short-patch-repair endonuclease